MLYEIKMWAPGSRPEAPPERSERVHADNWLDALRRGLSAADRPPPTPHLSCDLQRDESVFITDIGAGATFHVRPLEARAGGSSGRSRQVAVSDLVTTPALDDRVIDPVERSDTLDTFPQGDGLASGVTPMPSKSSARLRRLLSGTSTAGTLPITPALDEGPPGEGGS